MFSITEVYPVITRACLEIAGDNGGIHRGRSPEDVEAEIKQWLLKREQDTHGLPAMEAFLSSLTDEALLTVCTGEQEDIRQVLALGPDGLDAFLNRYFEEVC